MFKKDAEIRMEELVTTLNSVPLNIIITDSEGIIIWCNDTACEFTGYARDEIIGENPRILKSDETNPEIYEEMWDTIKTKQKIWTGRIKNKKKNGEIYEEELKIIPVSVGENNPHKFIGIQQDVTELNKLQKREKIKNNLTRAVENIREII